MISHIIIDYIMVHIYILKKIKTVGDHATS